MAKCAFGTLALSWVVKDESIGFCGRVTLLVKIKCTRNKDKVSRSSDLRVRSNELTEGIKVFYVVISALPSNIDMP